MSDFREKYLSTRFSWIARILSCYTPNHANAVSEDGDEVGGNMGHGRVRIGVENLIRDFNGSWDAVCGVSFILLHRNQYTQEEPAEIRIQGQNAIEMDRVGSPNLCGSWWKVILGMDETKVRCRRCLEDKTRGIEERGRIMGWRCVRNPFPSKSGIVASRRSAAVRLACQ